MKPTDRKKKCVAVLGGKSYSAIAAVEGLRMKAEGRLRSEKAQKANFSPEQRRAEIDRAFAVKPSKK